MAQIQINAEAVLASYNAIGQYSAEINGWMQRFVNLLNDKNQQTSGKFPLVKALIPKIDEEAQNVKDSEEVLDTVRESIQRYLDLAEEAVDTSAFN